MTSAFEGDLTINGLVLALNRGTAAEACYQSQRASGHCASEKYLLNVCLFAILSWGDKGYTEWKCKPTRITDIGVKKNPHAVFICVTSESSLVCTECVKNQRAHFFFKETIHSYSYIRSYMTLFFRKWAEENICDYFTDDKATANIPTSDWLPQKGYLANSWKLADCGNLDLQIWIRTISICGGHRKKQYMHAHIYQTLEATSKLWEPEGWHVANSMLRTHKY